MLRNELGEHVKRQMEGHGMRYAADTTVFIHITCLYTRSLSRFTGHIMCLNEWSTLSLWGKVMKDMQRFIRQPRHGGLCFWLRSLTAFLSCGPSHDIGDLPRAYKGAHPQVPHVPRRSRLSQTRHEGSKASLHVCFGPICSFTRKVVVHGDFLQRRSEVIDSSFSGRLKSRANAFLNSTLACCSAPFGGGFGAHRWWNMRFRRETPSSSS